MAGSASRALENKLLDHIFRAVVYTSEAPLYMALCTTLPTVTDTGSTIVEAGYTGYARLQIITAHFNAAATGSITTGVGDTFAACTAGTSTVVGWALCSALTLGNITVWGSCPSVTISTTQTPASLAIGALVITCT